MSKSPEYSKPLDGLRSDLEARRLSRLVQSLPSERREMLMEQLDEVRQRGFSPNEVSKILGKPVDTIRKWLRQGDLQGQQIGRSWIVPQHEIDRLLGLIEGDNPQ